MIYIFHLDVGRDFRFLVKKKKKEKVSNSKILKFKGKKKKK